MHDYRRTIGTQLYSEVKKNLFYQRARKYPSCLHSALHAHNIPVEVYHALIANVRSAFPVFHRYLDLRRRLLGVEELHYYDLYAHVVPDVTLEYSFEEGRDAILASVAPLGDAYRKVAARSFAERWMDVYPSEGKIGGAYSNGAVYDVHPYILLNYNGRYDDVSTVTHELGHTMHSYLSSRTQPYPTASYQTFVAEVASTFNESLLIDHMLKAIRDDDTRLSILGNYLENIKGTVFRQTQFAEFELRLHEMAAGGTPLTGAALADLYLEITKRYYGHDQKVSVVDDYVRHEWSLVPHFYRDFYVFQYATSFTASEALAQKVKAGDAAATRRYLAFLASGGSKHPIDLLKDAGVDMTTSEPLDLTVRRMNEVMDEIEGLI
jgi:oligoendopeptidase F